MSKVNLVPITGAQNVSAINDNFEKIAEALNDKVLYRGNPRNEPNQMGNDLDMNEKRIYNLPEPVLDHEPIRKKEMGDVKKSLRVSDRELPPLPSVAERRNKLVSFDANGNPEVRLPSTDSATELRYDLTTFSGNIEADAEWSDVPAHIDPAFDVQAQALANRVEALKSEDIVQYARSAVYGAARTVADNIADIANVKNFGAIGDGQYHPLSERFSTLEMAQVAYPHATSLSQSIDWAACQAAINTGLLAWAPAGIYVITDDFYIDKSLGHAGITGDGVDFWDPLTPVLPKRNSCGTHFQMYGTGPKKYTAYGATDNAVSGGAFDNPDPIDSLDTRYSLTSFHNQDASNGVASTLKQFSCGIYVAPGSRGIVLRGFRIHPYFDGIAGYNDTSTYALGDEWDVGIFTDNAPENVIEDVQCVGYWRIAARLHLCASRPGVQGQGYHCRENRVTYQGFRGYLLRGGDTYRLLQRTSNSVDIPWQDSHPFPAAGGFNTNSGNFTYTSTSKINDPTYGWVLRFNGVTGDTSNASQVRISSGWGIGGLTISNYIITGLEHSSGKRASTTDIGLGVSAALEVSGGFRQPFFSLGYIQSSEAVLAHLHNVDDLRIFESQFEANGKHGRLIASPQDINNTRVQYANGSTSITLIGCHKAGADEMPLVSRSITENNHEGAGFWQPRRIHDQDRQYPDTDQLDINPLGDQTFRVNLAAGRQFLIRDSASANLLTVNEATGNVALSKGQLSLPSAAAGFINAGVGQALNLRQGTTITWQITAATNLLPGVDAQSNVGSADRRIREVFAQQGSINTSDEREKEQWRAQTDVEKLAALEIKGLIQAFKFKGRNRTHFGVGAQTVGGVLRSHGLNPEDYSFWCYDEWEEQPELKDEEGNIVQEYRPAGNRYGIRYDELAMFILAAM